MLAIAIPNFVKARDMAQINVCIMNLRLMDAAKQAWALEKKKQSTDVPTASELAPYLVRGQMPKCPAGGDYQINAVGERPACSIPKHEIK